MATTAQATKSADAKAGESKPVFTYRSGRVWASVFVRTMAGRDGKSFQRFSTSIQKSYKDNGEWEYTSNFDEDDLFDVHVASQRAHEFIRTQRPAAEQAAE